MSDHAIRGHAELGGSGAQVYVNCPASVVLGREFPPAPVSEAMEEGTKMHELCELYGKNFLYHKAYGDELIDWQIEDPTHAAIVRGYIDFIWKDLLQETITEKTFDFETTVVIDANLHMWGSADFWAYGYDDKGKKALILCDLKTGRVDVEAEDNYQLLFYVTGLVEELKRRDASLVIDYIVAAIYQPRSFSNPEPKKVRYTLKHVDKFKAKLYKAAEAIYVKGKPKYKVGDWCSKCRYTAKCPAYFKQTQNITALKLVDVNKPKVMDVESLPLSTVAKIALNYDFIRKFLDATYEHAMQLTRNGTITDLKIVEATKGRRTWVKDAELVADVLIDAGLKEEQVYKQELIGISTAEALLKETKNLSKKDVEVILSKVTERTKSTESLVTIEDPRPALKGAKELLNAAPIDAFEP